MGRQADMESEARPPLSWSEAKHGKGQGEAQGRQVPRLRSYSWIILGLIGYYTTAFTGCLSTSPTLASGQRPACGFSDGRIATSSCYRGSTPTAAATIAQQDQKTSPEDSEERGSTHHKGGPMEAVSRRHEETWRRSANAIWRRLLPSRKNWWTFARSWSC